MNVTAFYPFAEGISLENRQIGYIKVSNISYSEKLYEPSTFSIETFADEPFTDMLKTENMICIKDKNLELWGIIKGLQDERGLRNSVKRFGEDLSAFLNMRLAVPDNLNGFDSIKGSTETVIKHYVKRNLVDTGEERKVPCFTIATDLHRGVLDDKYMARFEPVGEIIKEVGSLQKIGRKVAVKDGKMVFDVVVGTDRTAGQDIVPRVIFDVDFGTANTSEYIEDVSNYINLFYTSQSGADIESEAMTLELWREGESEPIGVNRKETLINISVDKTAEDIISEFKNLAQKEMTNYEREISFETELNSNLIYNKDYFLGDIVTIQDRFMGISEDVQLVEVHHQWNRAYEYSIKGVFGKPIKTRFDVLQRDIKRRYNK